MILNKEQIDTLKVILNCAASIENYISKFSRNVFRYEVFTKKNIFRKNRIKENEHRFLFYLFDDLHNIPELIETSIQLIDENSDELDFMPTIYLLILNDIKCYKLIINDRSERKKMKIIDTQNIQTYLRELHRFDAIVDALILNLNIFINL